MCVECGVCVIITSISGLEQYFQEALSQTENETIYCLALAKVLLIQ